MLEPHLIDNRLNIFLQTLGLEPREIEVYTILLKRGSMTTLEIFRKSSTPRTTLYRIIDQLKQKQLVVEVVEEYTTKVQAAPLSQLEQLISSQQSKTDLLMSLLPSVQQLILHVQSVAQPDTQVTMHRGKNGIRQMVWNVLEAQTEVVGYTYRRLDDFVGTRFMRRFREEFQERTIKGRDILGEEYYRSIGGKQNDADWITFKTRYISEQTLAVCHQLDIYNDVVAIYNWHEGEVFGVEIHNNKVAHMQRQLFEIIWNISKPIK